VTTPQAAAGGDGAYTGSVRVGGPAQTRDLGALTVTKVAVGPMDNNAYLLRCSATGAQLLIDAANEADRLLELIGDGGLDTVVTSHRHADHIQALARVVAVTGARTVAHPADAPAIGVPTRRLVEDGDEILVGRVPLRVIHLVGHTPGSVALLYTGPPPAAAGGSAQSPGHSGRVTDLAGEAHPHLFTGDCLFPGGPGNTFGDPDAFTSLMDDLERKVFGPLPDGTWIYPGHGADTVLGAERPHLREWRDRGW
jgi:glyoxylase-like metal-dependent hydrolase (beta-lactamase superfamily II)